ncbi:hypothetical protein ACHAWT_008318 [Skeletonema menzelii]
MVSTRVSKRKATERPKRQRRADEPPPKNKPRQVENKKKKVDAPAITPKKTIGTQSASKKNKRGQQKSKETATAKVVAKVDKVKNGTIAPKNARRKTTEDRNDDESSQEKEVRVKVRLGEKLNKGYRFARVNTDSSSIKKKIDKAQKKPSVAKRKPTVKIAGGGGDTRYQTIRVRVRVEIDAKVRVRLDKKLLKGDRTALINDCVMNHDGGEGQLIAVQKKKSPKITIRVGKKNEDGQHENGNAVTANQEKLVKRKQVDANEEKEDNDTDPQQQQQSPPPKKVKISQFGNDVDPKRLCIIDGCDKYKKARCGGHCLHHYEGLSDDEKAEIAKENELKKLKMAPEKKRCKVKGCTKYFKARHDGFCLTCYRENQDGKKNGQHKNMTYLPTREDESSSAKEAYGDEDLEEVTKVRVRCETKLQNGFCVAILSGNRTNLGLERPPSMSDEDGVEMEQGKDALSATATAGQPDFEVSTDIRRKENGALMCKAVGCPKIAQTKDNGFCRTHYNRFMISTGQCESWECKCGEKIATTSMRCGKCHRWKDGHHPAYASSPQKTPGAILPNKPITRFPDNSGVEISDVVLRNERGRPLCKVIGCGKAEQSNNDGFCRTHFNEFVILTDGAEEDLAEKWTCECGEEWSSRHKRCGNTSCQKWRGGKRESYSYSPSKYSGISEDNIIKDSKWTCDNCGEEVETRKSRCGSCHRWRGGKRQGGWKLGSASNYDSDDGGIDRTMDWSCDNCKDGEVISASQTRCGKCNRWRGGKRKPAPWECSKCKLSNPGGKKRCAGCLAWKGTAKKVSEPSTTATAAKSVPFMTLPAMTSMTPQAQAARVAQQLQQSNVTLQASNQVPSLPDFGTIDLTKLSYVNYDFNQSYYESSDYSYLNGSFPSSYFTNDTASTEEKKDEVEAR